MVPSGARRVNPRGRLPTRAKRGTERWDGGIAGPTRAQAEIDDAPAVP
jgi:hypothetical protein